MTTLQSLYDEVDRLKKENAAQQAEIEQLSKDRFSEEGRRIALEQALDRRVDSTIVREAIAWLGGAKEHRDFSIVEHLIDGLLSHVHAVGAPYAPGEVFIDKYGERVMTSDGGPWDIDRRRAFESEGSWLCGPSNDAPDNVTEDEARAWVLRKTP